MRRRICASKDQAWTGPPDPGAAAGRWLARSSRWSRRTSRAGYYLLYFSPFVAVFALWEVARRRLWRDLCGWILLAGGAAVTAAATLPFLVPYLELRERGFAPRPLAEVMAYSADALTYFRATDGLWLWPNGFADPLSTEAVLFQGITPMVLAAVALAGLAVALRRRASVEAPLQGWRLAAAVPVVLAGAAALGLARFELFAGRRIWRIREAWPAMADVTHVFALLAVAAAALVLLSPRARAAARLAAGSRRVFFTAALLAAVWLSFGPQATTRQHGISGPTIYAFLYRPRPRVRRAARARPVRHAGRALSLRAGGMRRRGRRRRRRDARRPGNRGFSALATDAPRADRGSVRLLPRRVHWRADRRGRPRVGQAGRTARHGVGGRSRKGLRVHPEDARGDGGRRVPVRRTARRDPRRVPLRSTAIQSSTATAAASRPATRRERRSCRIRSRRATPRGRRSSIRARPASSCTNGRSRGAMDRR